jgi:hypothetical protein
VSPAMRSSERFTGSVYPAGLHHRGPLAQDHAGRGNHLIRDARFSRSTAPQRSSRCTVRSPWSGRSRSPNPFASSTFLKASGSTYSCCRTAPANGRWAIQARKISASAAMRPRRAGGLIAITMPASPTSRCRIAGATELPADFGIHARKGPLVCGPFSFHRKAAKLNGR